MEKKQSSIEWLLFELSKNGLLPDGIPNDIHNKAKAMHKEEIESAWNSFDGKTFDQYYNETFGGDNE